MYPMEKLVFKPGKIVGVDVIDVMFPAPLMITLLAFPLS
jgi:hypothetical protein